MALAQGVICVHVCSGADSRMRALCALFLALLACSASHVDPGPASPPPPRRVPPPPMVHVCYSGVRPEMIPAIEAGVQGWRYATEGWRRWGFGAPCELTFTEREEGEGPCTNVATGCTAIGGLMRPRPFALVYLVRGRYDLGVTITIMHEIGHAFGLDHAEGGVMQAVASPPMFFATWDCPDSATTTRLEWATGARLRSCPVPTAVTLSVSAE